MCWQAASTPQRVLTSPKQRDIKKTTPLSPVYLSDSPIKHGAWCACKTCFTPPQVCTTTRL